MKMKMQPEELFEKACEAWGIEIRSDTQIAPVNQLNSVKRYLYFQGEPLDVVWAPEVAQDLAAFHGEDAVAGLVYALLDRTIRSMLGMELDKGPGSGIQGASKAREQHRTRNRQKRS